MQTMKARAWSPAAPVSARPPRLAVEPARDPAPLTGLAERIADRRETPKIVPSVSVGGRRRDDVPRVRADEEIPQLCSVPLDGAALAEIDCLVILTAHPGIDYRAAVSAAPLVFDAVGVTRGERSDHVVLL